MLKKKNIAMAMAFTTVATSVAPAFANTSGVQNIEVSSGETEKIAKINEKLAEAEKIMYSADRKTTNSQGEYTVRYVKFEKNSLGETSKNVPVYRVERTNEAGKEIIKVVDRGHRKEFETRWNPTTNRNDIVEVTYDHDVKGNNIEEKIVAQITINKNSTLNKYNVDAQLLFKSNGKYSEVGKNLVNYLNKDTTTINDVKTVVDGNKTGKQLTVHGNPQSFVLTVWGTPSKNTEDSLVGSLAGVDRCETAVQVSQEGWADGSANTIVLAGWNGLADGLAATPLASALNAPILIAGTDGLDTNTRQEIDRLKARKVVVVGGEKTVSPKVIDQLKAMGLEVERISGSDRNRTSFEIAKKLDTLVDVKKAYVAGGYHGEADALSIAAKAGQDKQPIILAEKSHIADDVKIWMNKEDVKDRIVVGGDYSIDQKAIDSLRKDIAADGITEIKRNVKVVKGGNIQETNAAVINEFHKTSNALLIAQDNNLVDALAAGPLAAKINAPVVLGTNNITESQKNAIKDLGINMANGQKVYHVGHGVARSVVKFIERLCTTTK